MENIQPDNSSRLIPAPTPDVVLQTLRMRFGEDGIVTLTLDSPGKSVNAISALMLAELSDAIGRLERETPRGLIIASAKKRSFIAGGDLFEISAMTPGKAQEYLLLGQSLYSRIEKLSFPTVAAINGDCLGGGLELALACKVRVAADESGINIGLPEVKLGILPGWGGTVRLPRLIGLPEALPLLLAGKTLGPSRARRAGIVDEIVRPEALLSAARRLVSQPPTRRKHGWLSRAASAFAPTRRKIFATARARALEQTFGNYPAPLRLIEVVRIGWEKGAAAGMQAERAALVDLMQTEAARNLIRLFLLRQGARKSIAAQLHAKPAEINYAAVIGGGTMGAGIVHALARAGVQVRLLEVDPKATSSALGRVRAGLDEEIRAGRLTALEARHALSRVAPSTQWTGLHLADIVIEAVVEKMPMKREIFARLDRLARPECVLATNTSSLSVSQMAEATAHPGRVVGLHFFNPVAKMPLVEVIRASQSDDAALATAAALATRLGKTAVLVKDAPGFVVNRILIPYLAEALALAGDGALIATVDHAMKAWGMPMGPFELIDEVGLDVSAHVLQSLAEQIGRDRIGASPAVDQALAQGWLGRKSGKGFYVYGRNKGAKPRVNEEMAALLPAGDSRTTDAPDDAAIARRLVLPMINEAARLLEEDVVDNADTLDLAMVLGTGFAPFRGGLVPYADAVGVGAIVQQLQELAAQHGSRFLPAPLLRDLAAANLPLHDFAKVPRKPGEAVPSVAFHP